MRNINRLKLSSTLNRTLSGSVGGTAFSAVDQVANDIGKPLKIVGIKIAGVAPTSTAGSQYRLGIGIGTTPSLGSAGELYHWEMYFDNLAGTCHTPLNETIGNMHDVLFELENWDTELNQAKGTGAVGSSKGELYLNLSFNSFTAVASVVQLRLFITLYYIV